MNLTAKQREILAQHLADQIEDPACLNDRRFARAEVLAENAINIAVKATAAGALRQVCNGCTGRQACREWATVDGYTGVAGGEMFYRGRTISHFAPNPQRQSEVVAA